MNIANEFIKENIEKHFQMFQSKHDVLVFFLLRQAYSDSEYWSNDGELLVKERERNFDETSFHLSELDILKGFVNLPIEKEEYIEMAKRIPLFNKASENLELLEQIIDLYKENIDDIISLNTIPYSEPYMSKFSYDFILSDNGLEHSNLMKAYEKKKENPKWVLHKDWEHCIYSFIEYIQNDILDNKRPSENIKVAYDTLEKIKLLLCPNFDN
jgi:hypothetical protein